MIKIKQFWQSLEYWARGLLIAIFLLLVGWVFLILKLSISYSGYCSIGFGYGKCAFFEYLYYNSLFIFFSLLWIVIPLLIISALIGLIIGKIKKK